MQEAGLIKKLDETTVNRIAAGEIIQRPCNAVKELLENSLDAKANLIQVTIKGGGMKYLQIQDNGTGIRKENLDIVCERFTTSKLQTYEDLSSIATFGFRGEALASISHTAHLSIQTKTAKDQCAYKANYEDGKLKAAVKPCAGNQGTIITIEDLFFNMPQRKQALKSANEEFQQISDILSKYAVHNAHVGFTLKKFGEQATIKTPANSTPIANIEIIYGSTIAKELISIALEDNLYRFRMQGLLTQVNYSAKKFIMLLFINQRLVQCSALKTAIDAVYSTYLPKGMHPFVYINLEVEPNNVDVNIHPTKHEVRFLYEDEIIDKIKSLIEAKLLGSNTTRTFYKQTKLSNICNIDADETTLNGSESGISIQTKSNERINPKDMIRTDCKEQKLDKFFSKEPEGDNDYDAECIDNAQQQHKQDNSLTGKACKPSIKLTSVLNMLQSIENSCATSLRKIFKEMVFVGVADGRFALVQFETKLLLMNTMEISEELFYQRLIYEFGNLPLIQIDTNSKLSVKDLVVVALNSPESGWTDEDGDKEKLAEQAAKILIGKAPIMREYFSLHINANGDLEALPCLLMNHMPSKIFLPLYLLRLATEVNWEEEEECFETFCRETAKFYARQSAWEMQQQPKRHRWLTEHVLYAGFKKYLLPPQHLQKAIFEVTNLGKLYKVFERC